MFRAAIKSFIGLSAAAALLIASLSGCAPGVEDEIVQPINGETKLTYKTASAQYMTIENEEKIPAEVGFRTATEFTAPFDVKVKKVNVSQNRTVKAGEVLVELDTSDLDFQINEQKIKVAQASGSDKELEQIELDKLTELREKADIVAPYDGLITAMTFLSEGSKLNEGEPICTVSVPDTIYVYNANGGGSNLRFGMDVDLVINNDEYEGTVIAAPDTAPSDAGKASLRFSAVELKDEDLSRLLSNEKGASQAAAGWATIYAVTVKRTNVLAVPESAVKLDGSTNYCSILSGEEKYDMPVEIGVTAGGYTEILSGINEGDVVILSEGVSNSNNNNNNNKNNNDQNNDRNEDDFPPRD